MSSRADLRSDSLGEVLPAGDSMMRSVVHLLRVIRQRFKDGRCAQVAGSLAFTTLLSLVPFITLVAVVLSKFPQSARLDAALRAFLLDNLLPEKAGKVIATYAFQFSQKATNLTIVGALVLVVTAVMLMRTIDTVINQIWMVRSRRPWATRLAAYWVALSFGPILLAGGVFLATAMLSMSLDIINEPVWLEAAGLRVVSVTILGCVFTALYYVVPHCSVRFSDAALAGFLAALAFVVMQRLFGIYLSHFPSYTLVYGAFAVVPIFLLWLYLSWIVILLGAVVAAVLPERDVLRRPLPEFPGRRVYVALLVLVELALAQRSGVSRDVARLSEAGRCGYGEIQALLEVLEQAGVVARREQGGWLLARAAEDVRAAEVGRLFGWDGLAKSHPVATAAGAAVDACWNEMLGALDASASVTLAVLAADSGGRGAGQSG